MSVTSDTEVGTMDTEYAAPIRGFVESNAELEDSLGNDLKSGILDSICESTVFKASSQSSNFPNDKSDELSLLYTLAVSVKPEPTEIREDSISLGQPSETNRLSGIYDNDLVPNETLDEKTEITEIVVMKSSDSHTIKVNTMFNNPLINNVSAPINVSEETSSFHDLSSFQLHLGPWKNYSVQKSLSDDSAVRFKCSKCEFYTSSGLFLKGHYKSKHFPELFSCDECLQLFVSKGAFRKHTQVHHQLGKQWKCLKCEFSTHQYNNLVKHRKKHLKPLQCVECNNNFSTRMQLRCHMFKSHADKADASYIYKCKICSSTFPWRSYLEMHMWKHFGIRPYSCNLCDYKSTYKKDITRHQLLQHFYPTKLRCSCCSKKFYDQKIFDDHRNSHLVHQCHLCSFKASSWRTLVKHCHGIHGKGAVKPLQCDICSSRFTYNDSLKKHLNEGRCKISHQCNLCPFKASAWRAVLAHGYAVHGNKSPKPFQCGKCPASFCHKRSLKKHEELKCSKLSGTVSNNPLQCRKCLRIFSEESYLDKHQKQNCKRPKGDRNDSAGKKALPDPVVYKCHACNEQFAKPKVLNRHLEFCVFNR